MAVYLFLKSDVIYSQKRWSYCNELEWENELPYKILKRKLFLFEK